MPEMEGLESIRILETKPALKIVAIPGAFDGLFLKAAEPFGVKATLSKPFSSDQLLEVVARVSVNRLMDAVRTVKWSQRIGLAALFEEGSSHEGK